jgi:DnaJ-domain-containing protein 1
MMLTTGFYGAAVLLVLAALICAQYRRTRRLQPVLVGLDPLPSNEPAGVARVKKRSDRVGSALRAWSIERAEADLEAPAQPEAPTLATMPELLPEVRPTSRPPRIAAAVEPPPAKPQAEWRDHSQWMPEPEPVRQPAPDRDKSAGEPAAKQYHFSEEPAASQDRFANESATNQDRFANDPDDQEEGRFMPPSNPPLSQSADYYEVLQISPNADAETIHRVYRIMASRFHPDNPVTGSLERFLQLREAYQTLSDADLRAQYDAGRQNGQPQPHPAFWQKSFVDGIEGETNRRLGVLSLLYQRRRISESKPGVSVMELEQRMAFPREYLNFTLWYLRSKGYVSVMPDNSDCALTSEGVDYVESSSNTNKVIRELLTAGTSPECAQPRVRSKVVTFPRTTARVRVEGSRRTLRRKQAGGRR